MRLVLLSFTLVGCGGTIVQAAEKAADEACACTTADCAKGVVAAFNKLSLEKKDEKAALSADDKTKFDAAVVRMDDCKNKLK
jgi:hypothetical protein